MSDQYDVVIVGSGMAGANIAQVLVEAKRRVLLLEAGPSLGRSREDFMENFFLNTAKTPSSPYPPNNNAQDPENTNAPRASVNEIGDFQNPAKSYFTYADGSLPFTSSYERVEGGTSNHWVGTCLRMEDNDFKLRSQWTTDIGLDWPIGYDDIVNDYGKAEAAIGVSADVDVQKQTHVKFPAGYQYPMRAVTSSLVDKLFATRVNGKKLTAEDFGDRQTLVTSTPAGRNTQPYQGRRVCHGNTNCTPICPIQAKYDSTVTLEMAQRSGYLTVKYKSVVDRVIVDSSGMVTEVHYLNYEDEGVPAGSGVTGSGTASGKLFVLAAHAVENAKILLNSPAPTAARSNGTVANSSDLVGRHLMDHPIYLAWGITDPNTPVFPYRGPLSTSGIETLRDGPFRAGRAAWRIEIGNEGWNWPAGDPYTTGQDFIEGTNNGGLNPDMEVLYGPTLKAKLNYLLTRQFRFAFLVEQNADPANRVQLSNYKDNLGIPRPLLNYHLSEYTMKGFASAATAAKSIMGYLGAEDHTKFVTGSPASFNYDSVNYNYYGAGHLCGTHIMGAVATNSVVDSYQRSWDHPNLYLAGCGSMPSIGTENPSLTMVALALRTADKILDELKKSSS